MPSLIDIRRRIRAVKNTQQITKAMKTVAASKLRRAQERVVGARPFAHEMGRVLNSLATRVDPGLHPLLATAVNPNATALLFVVTADKGLCGGFNSTVIRKAGYVIADSDREVALALIGRKGRDFFKRRGFDVRYEDINLFNNNIKYAHAQAMARVAIEQFTSGEASTVAIVYNEFKSVIQQNVVVEQLLPIPRLVPDEDAAGVLADHLFEPTPREIFDDLLPRHVEIQCFRALLESAAAEHAARMTAMDAATKNATEMVDDLTLYMNKVRQATITRELIEVVSGADAL
jgi:F-type H+-transporting ATPase subunit gamma